MEGGMRQAQPAHEPSWGWSGDEPLVRGMAEEAVELAQVRGAEYADARVVEVEEERFYATLTGDPDCRREHSLGIGVRVLLQGRWGFGARAHGDHPFHLDAAEAAIRMAGSSPAGVAAAWSPRPAELGEYRTAVGEDPFSVPLSRKEAILAQLLAAARARPWRGSTPSVSAATSSVPRAPGKSSIWWSAAEPIRCGPPRTVNCSGGPIPTHSTATRERPAGSTWSH